MNRFAAASHAPVEHIVGSGQRPLLRSFRFWIPACICMVAMVLVPAAFILGAVVAETQGYQRRSDAQGARTEQFLSQHPGSLGALSVEAASDGWAYPQGTVAGQADYELLADGLHTMFGDELGDRMLQPVDIAGTP